ncbi:phage tail protein [Desulfosarcina sp. OttesenSCG-928-A07]|nr:phage tail protein [Desulfosarcina sp. OttesenSCG-928-G17]MDL2329095.1 phage tail protein [Desulfosarcina sp. OttesenSCG-928-A07]
MIVGTFGPLTFEVSKDQILTLSDVQRENKGTYEEHKVLGARPRLEFLAPALQTFGFTIQLSAFWGVDIKAQLESIRTLVVEGTAERLIIGGTNYGHHIIESASESWHSLVSASVTLALKEYVK